MSSPSSATAAHPGQLAVSAIARISPYVPGKPISELEREYGVRDIIKLASNENAWGPSPAAVAAMRQAADDVRLYPDASSHALCGALAQFLGVGRERVTIGNGSNDLLVLLSECFLEPGRSAIYSQYGFSIYPLVIQATGAQALTASARAANDAQMPLGHDLSAFARLIRPDTRLVFIANPNNPTGTWLPADELREFIAAAPRSTLIVLDEAYLEFGREQGGCDAIEWVERFPNLVLLRTFSKAYGLAGARVGYAVSHPEVAAAMHRLRPAFNVNCMAQAGALAALGDQAHMRECVANTLTELRFLRAGLAALGVDCAPSAANFLLARVGDAAAIYQRLLHAAIIVRPMGGYALPEYLRITVGTRAQNERLLAALRAALERSP